MSLTPEVAQLLREAAVAEDADQRDLAEELYLRAMSKLEPADGEHLGTISINLGTNASDDGRPGDATEYYIDAIGHLEGRKGEAILQCAHAHYNLARLLLDLRMPAAIIHADAAWERYERFPFTSAVDLADAQVLQVVARAELGQALGPGSIDNTWTAVRRVPYEELNPVRVLSFLELLVSYVDAAQPTRLGATIAEIEEWADPTLAARLSRAVQEGHKRSRRALRRDGR